MRVMVRSAILLGISAAALASSAATLASSTRATCRIDQAEVAPWRGTCGIWFGDDGLFSIDTSGLPDTLGISFEPIGRDLAHVRGLSSAGINSYWGTARRVSAKGGHCWVGSDFRICIRQR